MTKLAMSAENGCPTGRHVPLMSENASGASFGGDRRWAGGGGAGGEGRGRLASLKSCRWLFPPCGGRACGACLLRGRRRGTGTKKAPANDGNNTFGFGKTLFSERSHRAQDARALAVSTSSWRRRGQLSGQPPGGCPAAALKRHLWSAMLP